MQEEIRETKKNPVLSNKTTYERKWIHCLTVAVPFFTHSIGKVFGLDVLY
jgi:hypothetical protein